MFIETQIELENIKDPEKTILVDFVFNINEVVAFRQTMADDSEIDHKYCTLYMKDGNDYIVTISYENLKTIIRSTTIIKYQDGNDSNIQNDTTFTPKGSQ